MTDELEVLIEEYKLITTYVNSTAMGALKVLPVALTALSALAVYRQPIPSLVGPGVALAIFTLLVWVGYCHALVNGYGLKLISMERKINEIGQFGENELSFHTWDIVRGEDHLPGFSSYTALLGFAYLGLLILALRYFGLNSPWPLWQRVITIIGSVCLDIAPLWVMYKSEKKTVWMSTVGLRLCSL